MSGHYDESSAAQIKVLEEQVRSKTEELRTIREELEEVRVHHPHKGASSMAFEDNGNEEKHKQLIQGVYGVRDVLRVCSLTRPTELETQRNAYAALEKQCVSLSKTNESLFFRLGRGEFDQSKLKCVELSSNPVSQDRVIRTTTLTALRKENDDLLAQLREAHARVGVTTSAEPDEKQSGVVPTQALDNLRSEYDKLEQNMRDRDKAFDRLKQAFGAKASEYVQAVKTLFGYDMHVLAKGKVKLRSVYARTSKGTSLTFDAADDETGSMRLVGEARQGAANVSNLKKYWLSQDRNSVPCFLAALQLELYESTTQAVRVGWNGDDDE